MYDYVIRWERKKYAWSLYTATAGIFLSESWSCNININKSTYAESYTPHFKIVKRWWNKMHSWWKRMVKIHLKGWLDMKKIHTNRANFYFFVQIHDWGNLDNTEKFWISMILIG